MGRGNDESNLAPRSGRVEGDGMEQQGAARTKNCQQPFTGCESNIFFAFLARVNLIPELGRTEVRLGLKREEK